MARSDMQHDTRTLDPVGSAIRKPWATTRAVSSVAFALAATLLLSSGIAWASTFARPDGMFAARVANQSSQSGGAQAGSRTGHHHMHEHLPQWIRQHGDLPVAEQERALRAQPGFDRLSPRRQQRLIHRLEQLDAMPPQRRERTLQRMEAMEKLSHDQRRQVRHTMRDVLRMPPDQRQKMREAFRHLAQLPPDQRQTTLDSQQFKSEFSDQQRQMLRTLMTVQPYTPSARPTGAGAAPAGK